MASSADRPDDDYDFQDCAPDINLNATIGTHLDMYKSPVQLEPASDTESRSRESAKKRVHKSNKMSEPSTIVPDSQQPLDEDASKAAVENVVQPSAVEVQIKVAAELDRNMTMIAAKEEPEQDQVDRHSSPDGDEATASIRDRSNSKEYSEYSRTSPSQTRYREKQGRRSSSKSIEPAAPKVEQISRESKEKAKEYKRNKRSPSKSRESSRHRQSNQRRSTSLAAGGGGASSSRRVSARTRSPRESQPPAAAKAPTVVERMLNIVADAQFEDYEAFAKFHDRAESLKNLALCWKGVLGSFKVDENACQDLWLLGQHSFDGYKQANSIIHKLLKKQADNDPNTKISNPSAFVHACVLSARKKLDTSGFDPKAKIEKKADTWQDWSEWKGSSWNDNRGSSNNRESSNNRTSSGWSWKNNDWAAASSWKDTKSW